MKTWLSKSATADGLAVLVLLATPLVFYFPVTLGWKTFSAGDINGFFLPFGLVLSNALAEGRLPLWTPDAQFGFPVFAEGQVAALYPLNLVLFRFLPIHVALSNSSLLHIAWAMIGMYVFCRDRGLSRPSAMLAGLVFGLNGFFTAHMQHLTMLAVASWLPWLLFLQAQYQSAWRARQGRWVGWLALTGLVIGLQVLAGFVQVACLNLAIFFTLGIIQFLLDATDFGQAIRDGAAFFVMAIGGVILGIGLSAVQWLPTLELVGLSVRSQEVGESFQTSFSLPPEALTQFLSPFAWLGSPNPPNLEYYGYLGIVPLFLMLLAPLLRRRARTWVFFCFALLSLSFALGSANPFYGVIDYIPIYNRFRVPARFMYPFLFASAFLAAEGFEELRQRLRAPLSTDRGAIVIGATLTLPIIGVMIGWERFALASWMNAWAILPLLLIPLTIGTLAMGWWRGITAPRFAVLILGLTLVDYALFSVPLSYTANAQLTAEELMQAPPVIQKMDPTRPLDRMFTNIYNVTLRPNHPMIYGRPSAQIYGPLALQRGEDYGTILTAAALNLANVRYYFLPSGPLPEEFVEPTASLVLDLFRNPLPIPPTRAAQLEITSYTNQTINLSDGFLAGEIILFSRDAQSRTLPLRIGIETADWAHEGLDAQHSKPRAAISFPAYLLSLRREFDGFKYVTRYTLPAPIDVTTVSARSYLPAGNLVIERVLFLDQAGQATALAALTQRNDFAVTFKSHAVTTLENRDMLPRAFIVHAAEIANDEQTLARLRDPAFRPAKLVLLSDGAPLRALDDAPNRATDQAVIVEYAPERIVIQAQTERAGYLILTDTFYPGWEARLDGQSVPIHRADYMFRAVRLEPGEHTVVFEYHPPTLWWGAVISGVSVILSLGLLGWRLVGSLSNPRANPMI